ncbi:MAG TPA: NAD(P)/FAD-dependent oxidoreductase, partial [Firmicutes bacterium]|nr:NAD(P)/FAD-dependent oxidoreductase [Bacillota bacterium]
FNIAGQETIYRPIVPVTALNAYGISMFSMGDVSETNASHTIIEEDPAKKTYRRIFIKNQIVIGAIIIGDTSKSPLLKTAIEQKLPLERIDCQVITIDELLELLKTIV